MHALVHWEPSTDNHESLLVGQLVTQTQTHTARCKRSIPIFSEVFIVNIHHPFDSMTTDKVTGNDQLSEQDLCRIKDFQVGDLPQNSGFVYPYRATFVDERNNNPVKRLWDAIDAHVSMM